MVLQVLLLMVRDLLTLTVDVEEGSHLPLSSPYEPS